MFLQKEYLEGGRKINYQISYPGSKAGMFIAKNYKVNSVQFAHFLMKTKLAALGLTVSKMLFRTLLKMKVQNTIKEHEKKQTFFKVF